MRTLLTLVAVLLLASFVSSAPPALKYEPTGTYQLVAGKVSEVGSRTSTDAFMRLDTRTGQVWYMLVTVDEKHERSVTWAELPEKKF